MALAGITSFIPADEAIDAMKSVGDRLPHAKETAEGGSQTPTALAWAQAILPLMVNLKNILDKKWR
ncbi:MAG: hypothetical protein ACLR2G_00275 [Phascolarctobacterium faecium]